MFGEIEGDEGEQFCFPLIFLDIGFEIPDKFVVGYALVSSTLMTLTWCVLFIFKKKKKSELEYFLLFSSSDFNLCLSVLQDYNEYFRDLNVSVKPFCKEVGH